MSVASFKSDGLSYSSIIVPFNQRWRAAIENGEIKAVYRKKGPSRVDELRVMYAYIGSPVSAICAKMEVLATKYLPVDDACSFCRAAMLTEEELREYAGNQSVFVFEIGEVILPRRCLDRHELLKRFGFQPSPSFVALSPKGAEALDTALGTLSKD